MNARHVLFKTSRFNLTKVKQNFINPCCFGEDLAAWLRAKLAEKGIETGAPGQEDWGWYLQLKFGAHSYFLGMSGNGDSGGSDDGEWRVIVKKNRSLWGILSNQGRIAADDAVVGVVEEILSAEPDFRDVRREAEG